MTCPKVVCGLTLSLTMLVSGCTESNQSPVLSPSEKRPARPAAEIQQHSVEWKGKELRYTLSIPPNYSKQAQVPLILALHFGGKVSPYYGRGVIESLVGPSLEGLGAVILAPDSIAGGWNSPLNEQAVLHLLDKIAKEKNTNPKRVLVTGFSMGGSGTWFFAGKHPDRFSAAIPVAGRVSRLDTTKWRTPIYAVHSRADDVCPLQPVQTVVNQLKKKGVDAQVKIVDGITHYETPRFQDALRTAVPWVRSIWKIQKGS